MPYILWHNTSNHRGLSVLSAILLSTPTAPSRLAMPPGQQLSAHTTAYLELERQQPQQPGEVLQPQQLGAGSRRQRTQLAVDEVVCGAEVTQRLLRGARRRAQQVDHLTQGAGINAS